MTSQRAGQLPACWKKTPPYGYGGASRKPPNHLLHSNIDESVRRGAAPRNLRLRSLQLGPWAKNKTNHAHEIFVVVPDDSSAGPRAGGGELTSAGGHQRVPPPRNPLGVLSPQRCVFATLAYGATAGHRLQFRETGPTAPLPEVVDVRTTPYLRLPQASIDTAGISQPTNAS